MTPSAFGYAHRRSGQLKPFSMPKIGLCEAAALYIDRGRCAGERHLSKRFACHSIANVGGSAEHSIANDRPRPGSAHGINLEVTAAPPGAYGSKRPADRAVRQKVG